MKRIMRLFCRAFGHNVEPIDGVIYLLEMTAINACRLNPELKCRRCGKALLDKHGKVEGLNGQV